MNEDWKTRMLCTAVAMLLFLSLKILLTRVGGGKAIIIQGIYAANIVDDSRGR